MTETADVVVVGAGVVGVSAAYHLAVAGAGRVVVLDREDAVGSGSTGRCAGGFRHQFSSRINIELSLASVPMITGFTQTHGLPLDVVQDGYLFLLRTEDELAGFRAAGDLQRSLGVDARELTPVEARELVPGLAAKAGVKTQRTKLAPVANDDRVDWRAAWRLFEGDVVYAWHAGRFASAVQESLEACGLEVRAQIIWVKEQFAISRGAYHWGHEPCWYAVRTGKPARWSGGRHQSTVWNIEARGSTALGHPTQKPVEAMERPIRNHGREGDVVYDPFVGSGTTLIACERSDRACVALELMPAFCDVVVARWESLTGRKAERASAERE